MKKHHVFICYKNFSKECDISHIGVGVTAQFTAKTLCHHGYHARAIPIYGADELMAKLTHEEEAGNPVTHVVISALFMSTEWMARIARRFHKTKFAVNCHSNAGFLQVEPKAIRLLREAIDLEVGTTNFFASANSKSLSDLLTGMYGHPVSFLPNLYYLHGDEPIHRTRGNSGALRIGAFGSHRFYKNFSTAIAAAIEVSHLERRQVEIWINAGRSDGNGNAVYQTARAWTDNVPNVTLKELHWCGWPEFRRFVSTMDLLLQPSYTESFNNVTADGVSVGVPSVVSDAIDWVPSDWVASADDALDVATKARHLLRDPYAARDGYAALKSYVAAGLIHWEKFLAFAR